jgi:DNA-binding IclR family transcriptional regulator
MIKEARSAHCGVDYDFNEYGIRRFAIPVFSQQELCGILAIAQRQTPGAKNEVSKIRTLLSQTQPPPS